MTLGLIGEGSVYQGTGSAVATPSLRSIECLVEAVRTRSVRMFFSASSHAVLLWSASPGRRLLCRLIAVTE
jgi:hypothetical protein